MKPRVLIGPAHLNALPHVYAPALTAAGLEFVYPPRNAQMSEAELRDLLPGCRASLAGSEPYTDAIIAEAAAKGLKVIARVGVGYDTVDTVAATAHGVAVTIAPGTNQEAVAEHTFLLILALLKSLVPQHVGATRDKTWLRKLTVPLRGSTLGIVGLGRIGKAVALRGKAFGTTVVAYEPFPDHAFVREHGIELLTLEGLLRRSDIVTLHVPSTPESARMIDAKALGLMKPNAYLINTARGSLVNEADLYEALASKRIAGAGLDVFDVEPPGDNPLLTLDNVVATAHTAGIDLKAIEDMGRVAAEAIAALLAGEWPAACVVNPEVKARFSPR